MLEAGILNTLLIRMDLPYATQLRCIKPPDIPLEGEEHSRNTMLLITNLLWCLVGSILSSKKPPECLKGLPALQQCAMWYYLSIIRLMIKIGEVYGGNILGIQIIMNKFLCFDK